MLLFVVVPDLIAGPLTPFFTVRNHDNLSGQKITISSLKPTGTGKIVNEFSNMLKKKVNYQGKESSWVGFICDLCVNSTT